MGNLIPHFEQPFNFGPTGQSPLVCDQESREDILNCVENILRYTIGFREDMPEFGIPDFTFETMPIPLGQIIDAILKFEPRAAPIVAHEISLIEDMVERIRVENQ